MTFEGSKFRTAVVRSLQACAVIFWCNESLAQMSAASRATQYFLEDRPTDFASRLPPTAREVIVAKVRVVGGFIYLAGRDQSGQRPSLPKDLLMVQVEILGVLGGRAATGERYEVYVGVPGLVGQELVFPSTPSQKALQYFVVAYVDEDNLRRLLGFPIGEQAYEKWRREVSVYERERGRPGARDR
jgi:hypothetical protein